MGLVLFAIKHASFDGRTTCSLQGAFQRQIPDQMGRIGAFYGQDFARFFASAAH